MHESESYECPFCRLLALDNPNRLQEIVFEDEAVVVFPALHHKKGNEGNLLVVPHTHIENLYGVPEELALPAQKATQRSAFLLNSVLHCDGITIRQHNEPAGSQDVWHFHVHVIPRYDSDSFDSSPQVLAGSDERVRFVKKLQSVVDGS